MKTKEEILEIINTRSVLNKEQVLNAMEVYATQCQEDMAKDVEYWQEEFEHWHKQAMDMSDTLKVTRFEVIDENGKVYTKRDCKVELSYQDDGRTLKVFIKSLNKQDYEN